MIPVGVRNVLESSEAADLQFLFYFPPSHREETLGSRLVPSGFVFNKRQNNSSLIPRTFGLSFISN